MAVNMYAHSLEYACSTATCCTLTYNYMYTSHSTRLAKLTCSTTTSGDTSSEVRTERHGPVL